MYSKEHIKYILYECIILNCIFILMKSLQHTKFYIINLMRTLMNNHLVKTEIFLII